MFTLRSIEGNLQLSKKRLGIFVEKSDIPNIYKNDEVVEINNLSAFSINEAMLKCQLSEPNITMLILPNDKEQLKQTCLKANNIYVEKSRLSGLTKIRECTDNLIQVMDFIKN